METWSNFLCYTGENHKYAWDQPFIIPIMYYDHYLQTDGGRTPLWAPSCNLCSGVWSRSKGSTDSGDVFELGCGANTSCPKAIIIQKKSHCQQQCSRFLKVPYPLVTSYDIETAGIRVPPTIYSPQPMDNQNTMAEWGIMCYPANHGYAKLSPASAASVSSLT
jgi:hypothetical protein